MTAVKIDKFSGMLPAWEDTLLPANQAALSLNAYLYSGAIQGWRKPKLLRVLADSASKYAFRVPQSLRLSGTTYLVFEANPNAGDTVGVGEFLYTFTATVTSPYDVLIGTTTAESAANLGVALTGAPEAGLNYAFGTTPNPVVSIFTASSVTSHDFGAGLLAVLPVRSADFGVAFNAVPVTESTDHARMRWLADLTSETNYTSTFANGANEVISTAIDGVSNWLEFADPDTTVIRSPIADDKFGRYYWASPSKPPQYNTYDRIATSQPPFNLGVPAPGVAPDLAVSGGGNASTVGFTVEDSEGEYAEPGVGSIFLSPIVVDGATQIDDINASFAGLSQPAVLDMTGLIYSDRNGEPYRLLAVGNTVQPDTDTPIVDRRVVTSILPVPYLLQTGVTYWIGFQLLSSNPDSTVVFNVISDTETDAKEWASTSVPEDIAPEATTTHPTWLIWGNVETSVIIEARSYVYTWVTAYDEEGPPSPPVTTAAWQNSKWALTLFPPPAEEMGVTRNITKTRIYRTITSIAGVATYFFVAEIPVATLAYTDAALDTTVLNNTQLQSTLWQPPPEGLQGLYTMPNGMVVGFKANELWFCEPYRPHAWPPTYVLTTDFPIVGLGIVGQGVVAVTEGYPHIAAGINPANLAEVRVKMPEPCISRGSILSTDQGVYYASVNGLIFIDSGSNAANATERWVTRERWRELTPAKYIRAIKQATGYFAFGTTHDDDTSYARDGFTVELAADAQAFSILPQAGAHRIGFGLLSSPSDVVNVMTDTWSGVGLIIRDGGVYYYDYADQEPEITPYRWRSRLMQGGARENFEAVRVFFDIPPGTPAQSETRNVNTNMTLADDMYGIVRVFADGELKIARELRRSGELLRVPSGFKADFWQLELEGRVKIKNVQFATSVHELGSV